MVAKEGELLNIINEVSWIWLITAVISGTVLVLLPYFVVALPLYGFLIQMGVDHRLFLTLTFYLPIFAWHLDSFDNVRWEEYDPEASNY